MMNKLEVVHTENARYRMLLIYRKYGRDIGPPWMQEVLDELHRRSLTSENLPAGQMTQILVSDVGIAVG